MLGLLVPGVGMGAGDASASSSAFIAPIGIRYGVQRPDAPDINSPTGMSGVTQ